MSNNQHVHGETQIGSLCVCVPLCIKITYIFFVCHRNEYLAVRNAEGGFYVCQAMQNVYRTTRKIKIRWLSQDKAADPSGETYKPDFYDTTGMLHI